MSKRSGLKLKFQLKGVTGQEKVTISIDGNEEEFVLTTEWQTFSYPRPSSGSFSVKFLNDNGPRDVYIRGHESQVADLLPDFASNKDWGCGTDNENERCTWLRNGQLAWNGKYTYTLKDCPQGWKTFGGDCYLIIPQTVATYASAEKKCEENGAVLVSPETEEKNEFLEDMLDEARDDGILPNSVDIWLSARRPSTSAPFTWKTGESLGYSDWYEGQPRDNHGGIALCMQTFKNSGKFWSWHVANCDGGDADQAVVCEKVSGFSISGGPSPNEGNIFYNGAPICDDVWDNTDARVFCRMFGYQDGTATHHSTYGQVSSHFSMDNVQCNGNEVSLLDCPHLTQDNCGSHEGAGVKCSGFSISGGPSPNEGNVFYNGAPICDDVWDNTDARVYCRMFGYQDGTATHRSTYGQVSSLFSMDNVQCNGNEVSLLDCPRLTQDNCGSHEGAGVICSGYLSLGCWKDTSNRAITTLEGTDTRLTGNYWERKNAVELCFEAAKSRGYPAFAIQHGGECFASSTALETYKKYGAASNCADGKGGGWANDVYKIQG